MTTAAPKPKRGDPHLWRVEQFSEHLPAHKAEILALSGSDLNAFRLLVAKGCPPDIAFDIVR